MTTGGGMWVTMVRVVIGALKGPRWLRRPIAVATLSVAQALLGLRKLHLVDDVSRVKESLVLELEAKTALVAAEARKRTAEAIEMENRAAESRRVAIADARKAEAEAKRLEAEASIAEHGATITEKIALDIYIRPNDAEMLEKIETLKASIRRLQSKGGALLIDTKSMQRLIDAGLPLDPDSDQDE